MTTFSVGQRLRVVRDVWDDGADCHPPGYVAREGDIVFVKRIDPFIHVAHAGATGSFWVHSNEVEPVTEDDPA